MDATTSPGSTVEFGASGQRRLARDRHVTPSEGARRFMRHVKPEGPAPPWQPATGQPPHTPMGGSNRCGSIQESRKPVAKNVNITWAITDVVTHP